MKPAPRGRIALAFALLALAALAAAGDPGAPARRPAANLVGWWQHEELCRRLGIGAELRRQLAAGLENLQTSYQIAQTRLAEARRKQSAMLLDPAVGSAELLAFNRAEVVVASERMQSLNFEARLLVRGRLAPVQLAKIGAEHPQFFTARWFKASAVPVLEGRVAADGE